jgi:curved DNA-binding protein
MPSIPDLYKTLGVSEGASAEEIKKSYRTLAREHHPDRNPDDPNAEERFKEIQQAYEILGSEQKRSEYDRMRRDPFASRGVGGPEGAGRFYRTPDGTYVRVESTGFGPEGGFSFSDEGNAFGDLFERFFGGRGGHAASGPARPETQASGSDIEARVKLSFEEALKAGKKEVVLPSGEKVRISVPEGVEDGTRVRLRGRGQPGPRGQRGDLYITFDVQPSTRFRREGRNLITTETINIAEAILGTARTLTNAYGEQIRLQVPPGTQPGERLRLRGQGVRTAEGFGDLYVEMRVVIPTDLSDEAKTGVRIWAEGEGLIDEQVGSEE